MEGSDQGREALIRVVWKSLGLDSRAGGRTQRGRRKFLLRSARGNHFPQGENFPRNYSARRRSVRPSVAASVSLGPSVARSEYFKEDIFLQMSRGIFRFHGPYPFRGSETVSAKETILLEFDKRWFSSSPHRRKMDV